MNRLLKPFIVLLAGIYFVVDAVFMTVARPLADWLADRRLFDGIKAWILSLRPYPTLALLAVPLVVLEPIKPLAAYLAATGHVMAGAAIFVVGEILKLVLVERLFALNRDKLMSIGAFAWAYLQYRQVRERLESVAAWQTVRRWSKIAHYAVRMFVLELSASPKPVRISVQPR